MKCTACNFFECESNSHRCLSCNGLFNHLKKHNSLIKMETKQEQIVQLKDGRTIFKTHNGFKSFVRDKKDHVTEVTSEYYKEAFKNRVKNGNK